NVLMPGTPVDSLGGLTYFGDLLPQTEREFRRIAEPRARVVEAGEDTNQAAPRITTVDDPTLPRVCLVHDSFAFWLTPFLEEHCSRLVTVWQYALPQDVIGAEKPDVVVEMFTDRKLMDALPALPQESEPVDAAQFE